MTVKARRAIACSVAAIVLLMTFAPFFNIPFLGDPVAALWIGGQYLLGAADHLIPPGAPGQNLNTNVDRGTFESLSVFGLGIAMSLSVVYCFWDRRPTKTAILVSYFLFLGVLMSLSTANFAMGDSLLNRKAQALIDLVLVIIGSIVVLELLQLRPTSNTGVVLRTAVVFLIVFQGITIPAFFGLLWFLNWENIIGATATENLNPAWFSALAGLVSAIVAVLNYRNAQKTLREGKANESRIIVA